jgi:DNA-binding CsgD family transcriptional regulator
MSEMTVGPPGHQRALRTLRVRDSEGVRLVVVQSPPGEGRAAAVEVRVEGAAGTVLAARAQAAESDLPFGVVRQLFESLLGEVSVEERRALLRGSPGLAGRLIGSGGTWPIPAGAVDQHTASQALYGLTMAIAGHGGLLLIVDEVQWADAPSLHYLTHLARRLDQTAVTMALTSTPGEPAAEPNLVAELLGTACAASPGGRPPDRLPGTQVVVTWSDLEPAVPPVAALTPHQRRLVAMALDGRTNGEIAQYFSVSRRAVEFHFTQIYRKLGICGRVQLYPALEQLGAQAAFRAQPAGRQARRAGGRTSAQVALQMA